ncbi:MAG TPA: hypothetical protein VM487_16685 [Phycisphaerae bacterium]|nr:hypothetical protein [Phycisphaerae bacterium]
MDCASDLTAAEPRPGHVNVDQAIFTSVRSAMADGYRIIASCPGLTTDEKREITQRSPSHDGLCDSSPAASGLASYPLGSGRRCIAVSRHAGIEHTGRGGQRVYTHLVVLDCADFRRFRCDPLEVQAALRRAVGDDVILDPSTPLDRLALPVPESGCFGTSSTGSTSRLRCNADRIGDILSAVLSGRCIIVSAAPAPRETLSWTLRGLPRTARESLAACFGLKLTPNRILPLAFIDSYGRETERMIRGREVVSYDWQSPPAPESSPFDPWIRFVRSRWEQGRLAELEHLSARLTEDVTAQCLERIATLATDIDLVRNADGEALATLIEKHAEAALHNEAEAGLLREFHRAAETRKEQLHELPECPAAD